MEATSLSWTGSALCSAALPFTPLQSERLSPCQPLINYLPVLATHLFESACDGTGTVSFHIRSVYECRSLLTEQYRQTYTLIRPHSSLDYGPSAPLAVLPAEPLLVIAALT